MKKIICIAAALIMSASSLIFAQERKPVIGLTEIQSKNYGSNLGNQVRASFSSAIVNSKRFAVMERSAAELDKIRRENIETNGSVNPNSQLDFLLTGEIVNFVNKSETKEIPFIGGTYKVNTIALTVSVKFTDVQSGQIVISENFTKEFQDKDITVTACADALANELVAKIVEKLYPPMVLSVSGKNKSIMIPNSSYSVGDVLEIFEQGEPLIDPYTGSILGYEEESVALVVVYEIGTGRMANIAKAAPDPKGKYANADIHKGQLIRAKIDSKGKKEINKAAIANFKKAGLIKSGGNSDD